MASRRPSQVVASIKARCCLHASVQKKALPSRRSDSRSRLASYQDRAPSRLTSRGGAVLALLLGPAKAHARAAIRTHWPTTITTSSRTVATPKEEAIC
jgi:hypothetical protein